MAHGFLSPTPVTGESPISKYFEKKVDELIGKGVKKLEDVARDKFDQFKNQLFKERIRDTTYRSGRGGVEVAGRYGIGKNTAVGGGILGGSSVKGLLPKKAGIVNTQAKTDIVGRNATNIDRKEGKYLPTSDPDVAGGPKTSKGRYVNMPGVASASGGGLKDTGFFSATGELDMRKLLEADIPAEEKKVITKNYRASQRAKGIAPTGETGAPPITPDSGADIVAALSKQTQEIVRLVDLTREQTKSQQSMHNEQQAHADRLASRALARGEEKSLEKGSDLSGFTKAERFARLLPGAGGTGGGRGGGPGMGIGGKAATGALVKAVGKRGAQRVGTRLAAKYGGKAAAKAAGKYGGKAAAKVGLGGAAKIGAGAIAKSAGKKIPLVGLGLGAIFAAQRALEGDFIGAGLELASGAASTVPGIGTAGSIGIDAALAARDMGMTPFAKGGIITQPTNALMGEAGKEGVFPLEGRRGRNAFEMMGEGFLAAQEKNKSTFAELQAAGLKFYFQNQDGFKFFGNILKTVFGPFLAPLEGLSKLGGGLLNSLLGGPANATESNLGANYLTDGSVEGNKRAILAAIKDAGYDDRAASNMLAQIQGESGFKMQSEGSYKNTSAARIRTVMGQRAAGYTDAQLDELKLDDKKFFDAMYGNDMGNAADEGFKYRGRGFIQLTGKNNYKKIGDIIGVDLVKNPDLMNDPAVAAKASVAFFKTVGANNQNMSTMQGAYQAVYRGNPNATTLDDKDRERIASRGRSAQRFLTQMQSGQLTGAAIQENPGGPGSGSLASAAESLRGMSTRDGPGGGSVSCVYAVNKVFNKAGMTPPWGGAQDTLSAIRGMKAAGWQQVGFGEAQPGDVWVYDDGATKGHVGIKTSDGKVLSNSSSKASFTWAADQSELLSWYPAAGLTPPGGTFFRPPSTDSVTQPANPIASAQAYDSNKTYKAGDLVQKDGKLMKFDGFGFGSADANAISSQNLSGAPSPAPAATPAVAAASPNTGTPIMATSAQVASASTAPAAAPTIINNYYGGGGEQGGVVPNGVSPGIGMQDSGTAVFQDLRIRSLA